jgi:hypothetical protein
MIRKDRELAFLMRKGRRDKRGKEPSGFVALGGTQGDSLSRVVRHLPLSEWLYQGVIHILIALVRQKGLVA